MKTQSNLIGTDRRLPVVRLHGNSIVLENNCMDNGSKSAIKAGATVTYSQIAKEQFFLMLTSENKLFAFKTIYGAVVIGSVTMDSFTKEGLYIRPLNVSFPGATFKMKEIAEVLFLSLPTQEKETDRAISLKKTIVEWESEKGYRIAC